MSRSNSNAIQSWLAVLLLIVSTACGRSDSTNAMDLSNSPNEELTSPIVYTALGDSTGVGVGAKEGGGYVARLFERIKKERPGSTLTNLCVSGATTDDVLRSQVHAALNSRPTLITLGIGINDLGRGSSVERFAQNYEAIIKRLRTLGDIPIVVTNIPDISFAPVIPAGEHDSLRARIRLFNDRIAEISKRYKLLMVDAYTETHRLIPAHPEFFSEDGFHPSDAGYENWTKTMWPTVRAAIGN